MASIQDAVKANLTSYAPAEPLPTLPQMMTDNRPKANPSIRCPLPPFNSNPDTLRQFETGTQMPQIRVIPLPVHREAAPTRATVASIISNSTSGGATATTTLEAASVSLNTGGLAAGDSFTGYVLMAASFQLLSLTADSLCEVRLYGTNAALLFDNIRVEDDPIAAEITQNVISCVSFDTIPYLWSWQNRIASNQDVPQSTKIYVAVFNRDVSPTTGINITISYVPIESV